MGCKLSNERKSEGGPGCRTVWEALNWGSSKNDEAAAIKELNRVVQEAEIVDVNERSGRTNEYPIRFAASKGWAQVVKLLLDWGAEVGFTDGPRGQTLLHYVVQHQPFHREVCRVVLDNTQLLGAPDAKGRQPLQCATDNDYEALKMLLAAGANTEAVDLDGWTALHTSCLEDRPGVPTLLEAGAKVNATGKDGMTALHCAATKKTPVSAVKAKILIEHGADIAARTRHGKTALDLAMDSDAADTVEVLLEGGAICRTVWHAFCGNSRKKDEADVITKLQQVMRDVITRSEIMDVNERSERTNEYPIQFAASKGWAEVVKLLLDCGARIRFTEGTTLLHQVVQQKPFHREVCKVVLDNTELLGATDAQGRQPLQCATDNDYEALKMLLAAGADTEAVDLDGWTALHTSCLEDRPGVPTLLEAGAKVNATGKDGMTALHCVATGGTPVSTIKAKILIEHGADVAARTRHGKTALDLATESGAADMVKVLLEEGARTVWEVLNSSSKSDEAVIIKKLHRLVRQREMVDVNVRDREYPIQFAASKGWAEVVKLLLDWGAETRFTSGPHGPTTLLHQVVQHKPFHRRVCKVLLDDTELLGATDAQGRQPVQCASDNDYEALKMLLAAGADTEAVDLDGWTALHTSCLEDRPGVPTLLEAGAKVNATGKDGMTALHCVATKKTPVSAVKAKILIEHGADIAARTRHGKTALDLAMESSSLNVVEVLLEAGAGELTTHNDVSPSSPPMYHTQTSERQFDDNSRQVYEPYHANGVYMV